MIAAAAAISAFAVGRWRRNEADPDPDQHQYRRGKSVSGESDREIAAAARRLPFMPSKARKPRKRIRPFRIAMP
jgi:hypothetical protein